MKKIALLSTFLYVSLLTMQSDAHHNSEVNISDEVLAKGTESNIHTIDGVKSLDLQYINNTLHVLLGRQIKGRDSFWYLSSLDDGLTWNKVIEITKGQSIKAKMQRGNDARIAVQGNNIVVVWTSKNEEARFGAGPMITMRSADKGKTWQQTQSPADWHQGSHSYFAMDANDQSINLIWLDNREKIGKASQGLRFSTTLDGGKTWSKNQTLDKYTCSCCWNTAKFINNDFYVLYRDKEPSDMTLGRLDENNQWKRINTVGDFKWDFDGCPHMGGSLAFDPWQQLLHATVSTGHTDHIGAYYLRSHNQGQTWSTPIPLDDDTAVHSSVAVSQQRQLVSSWDRITESGYQIVYMSSQDNGETWTDVESISTNNARATHPHAVGMTESVTIFWTESDQQQSDVLRLHRVRAH